MEIIKKKFTSEKTNLAGRPSKYGFNKLQPGDCMIIDIEDDYRKQINRVRSSLHTYVSYNNLDWETVVRKEGNNICVYRIS